MRQWLAVGVVILALVFGTAASPDAQQTNSRTAQARPATAKPYVPPRTPWGDPDIQGGWTNVNENGIPMEKPNALGEKSLEEVEDAELADLIRERNERAAASAAGIGGRETGAGPTHWYEHYNAKNSRAWMVVDPPTGLIPELTAAAQQRLGGRGGRGGAPAAAGAGGRAGGAAAAAGRGGGLGEGGRADSWLDRSLYDRCITRGFPGSMTPAIYGNAYDITQAPGMVAIRYEMVHETRVIRLDNSPRSGQRSHMGDARGRWEGNTLVVETMNLRTPYRNGSPSQKLIERFVPTAPGVIEWSMTIDDPQTWVRPWTYAMRLTADPDQPLFEYACHEGNYAMRNILSAARAEEARAAGQK
ncbi:MAG TPA: hypothetical protein VFO21_25220 [Vicinamibacterales bacterium]|nr:hypothetical protein [Vicinamibacterales bacterium]